MIRYAIFPIVVLCATLGILGFSIHMAIKEDARYSATLAEMAAACTPLDEPLARRCSPYYNTGKPGDSLLWQQCMGVAPK